MPYSQIDDYAVIGNMRTSAHVSRDGSIDWCCLPRFDSPSVFAAILDEDIGGRFVIQPEDKYTSSQRYLPETNVVETIFTTRAGSIAVIDFMPCYGESRRRAIGPIELHRLVRCSAGQVQVRVFYQPRMQYAKTSTSLSNHLHGVLARIGNETMALSSPVKFDVKNQAAQASFALNEGEQVAMVLRYGVRRVANVDNLETDTKLERTMSFWQDKAAACSVAGPYRDAIVRAYLALHLLVYAPTGAIVAAPTTSLPERIGGDRNWDYRYTWLRDASLTLFAFAQLGHLEETHAFMAWLLEVCEPCGAQTRVLYQIDSSTPPDEYVLPHLDGHRASKPVRIGNAAYSQSQLDVYGEVLEAAYAYQKAGGYISRETWRVLARFVEAAASDWTNTDNGIWEVRGAPRHITHSKLMCWVAIDRGIRMARRLGYGRLAEKWKPAASEIKASILQQAWNPDVGAFTQYYGASNLDASVLLLSLTGLISAEDSRMASTVDMIEKRLLTSGFIRRYNTEATDDGLDGDEGAFLWCSFWLARNFLRMDRAEEARILYERVLACANHVGLLSEMVDPQTNEALGNMPQALTHLGVIVTGLELSMPGQSLSKRSQS